MTNQIVQKAAMVARWAKILTGKTEVAVEQGPGKVYQVEQIAGYYNDLTGKVSPNTLVDSNGVPICVIAGGKKVHFPIAIFQYALGCWDIALLDPNKSIEMLSKFERCADWALNNQRADGSWDTFGPVGSTKYSVSSMAQGEGVSVLLRAAKISNDNRYLTAAEQACRFMLSPYERGGTSFLKGDYLFLEEYPQIPRRSVLNGWVFSLFGLYDLSLYNADYKQYFDRSAATLALCLDDYDAGFWSYYDLQQRLSSPAYHLLHIAQLKVLTQLTGDVRFENKAAIYEGYQSNPTNRRKAILYKAKQKIFEESDAVILQ